MNRLHLRRFYMPLRDVVIIRCDSIIDAAPTAEQQEEEETVIDQLGKRFFRQKISTIDLRKHLTSGNWTIVVNACREAEESRILVTVDPSHADSLASVLATIPSKLIAIAAVSVPAVMKNSDADFILGMAFGALCVDNMEDKVFIANAPGRLLDSENGSDFSFAVSEKSAVSFNTNKWLIQTEKYNDSDAQLKPDVSQLKSNELLARWLVSTATADSTTDQAAFHNGTNDQNSSLLSAYYDTVNSNLSTWLHNASAGTEVVSTCLSDQEFDYVLEGSNCSQSNFEQPSSIRSCELVPDIEELAICSPTVDCNTGSSMETSTKPLGPSNKSTPRSSKTLRSCNSSWLKVICRAEEPCIHISECMCEPNCSAQLLQSGVVSSVDKTAGDKASLFSFFDHPFNMKDWLKGSEAPYFLSKVPKAKITEKGPITFPPPSDLKRWLIGSRSYSNENNLSTFPLSETSSQPVFQMEPWLKNATKQPVEMDTDDGLESAINNSKSFEPKS